MDEASNVREQLNALASVARATAESLSDGIEALCELTVGSLQAGGKIMFAGNGGSAADAQHLATEYVVRFSRNRQALAALALTTDTSLLTAAANDLGFDTIFARQVEALGRPEDLLVLHSTSGESENLVQAAAAARAKGIGTVALLAKGGGRLSGAVDLALVVPTDSTARAQELHLTIGHIVCDVVDQSFLRSQTT